ncbi:uncharacterized protein [Amphiura filiformis]|uniref:uncharacterized protein n=1 Tax=Amphiura filiformis TaxID=82378 RepID=UPI003B2288F3
MDTPKNRNFFKLAFILLEIVTEQLRNVFKQEWDKQHPNNPWRDDNNSLQYFIQILKNGRTWKNNKSKVPKSGNRSDWDPTALFFMLLYSGTLNLPAVLKQHIDKLRQIRNEYFGHPSTASLSNAKFQAIYKDIEVCVCGLNCPASVKNLMDDIRTGVMKVPEDYMKVVEEKLCKIERYNHKLLLLLVLILAPICVMVLCKSIQQYYHTMDFPVTTTYCNRFGTYFPESLKPNYYVGQDMEIDRAVSVLSNGTYQMVTITGPPAIGKTATAIAIGQVLMRRHNFQVAFVDFKQLSVNSNHLREDMYKEITLALDFESEIDVASLQEFKTHIRKISTCQTLLIFDNTEQVLDSISKSEFIEVTKLCLAINKINILATSRKDFNIIGVSIYPVKLEPLSEAQSVQVLQKLSPNSQASSVLEICKKIRGVPLLLELTGSLLQRGVYEEDELLGKLEELSILVIVNDTEDYNNYFKFLKTLFDGLDPDIQETFIALGTIPTSFDQMTANVIVKLTLKEKVDLYPLVDYNLLKKFHLATGHKRYEMHPILQEFSKLIAKEKPWWSLIQTTSSIVFFDYNKHHNAVLNMFWTHIENIVATPNLQIKDGDLLLQEFENSLSSFDFFGKDELRAEIYRYIGALYQNTEQFDKALSLYQKAFEIYSNLHGSHYGNSLIYGSNFDQENKLNWYDRLTNVLLCAPSIFFLKQQNDLNYYTDHKNIAKLVIQLAQETLQDNTQALSTVEKYIEKLPQSHLGSTSVKQIQPEYDGELSQFEIRTANMMHTLGLLLYHHGFYQDSLDTLDVAFRLVKQDPYRSSHIIIHIGYTQYRMQEMNEAAESLCQAVQIRIQSGVLNACRDIDSSKNIINKNQVDLTNEIYDCALTSNAALFAGVLLENMHLYHRSIQMLETAQDIDGNLLGNHLKTILGRTHIANLYVKIGDVKNALQYEMTNDGKAVSMKGVFNFHLSNQQLESRSTHLEETLCVNDHAEDVNRTLTWYDKQDTSGMSSFQPHQMLYQLDHSILDQPKVWASSFDLVLIGIPEMLNITLLPSYKHSRNADISEIHTDAFRCQMDDTKMNKFISHRKSKFPKDTAKIGDSFYSKYNNNIVKFILSIQNSDGDSVTTSILKFMLAHLYEAQNDHRTSLYLFREAFEIITKPDIKAGILKKPRKKPGRKAGPESLQEFLISSILLYGTHPHMENVSITSLNKAFQHHKALGNEQEASQILIAIANVKKDHKKHGFEEAGSLFYDAIMTNNNYWQLSSYLKVFLSSNEQGKHEARQAHEYGNIALELGFLEHGIQLLEMAKEISKTSHYSHNCEPLLFQYILLRVHLLLTQRGIAYMPPMNESQITSEIMNITNPEQICGIDTDHHLYTTWTKVRKLDDFKEIVSILLRQHLYEAKMAKMFVKAAEDIQKALLSFEIHNVIKNKCPHTETSHILPYALDKHGYLDLALPALLNATATRLKRQNHQLRKDLSEGVIQRTLTELTSPASMVAKYFHKQGNLPMSLKYHKITLRILKLVLQDDVQIKLFWPIFAETYRKIGLIYTELQQYKDAALALSKALEILLQPDHILMADNNPLNPVTTLVAFHLGVAYQELGQYDKSIEPFRIASDISEQEQQLEIHFHVSALLAISYNWTENYEVCYQKILLCLDSTEINNHPIYYQVLQLGLKTSYKMADYSTGFWCYKELVKQLLGSGLEGASHRFTLALSSGYYDKMLDLPAVYHMVVESKNNKAVLEP